MLRSSICIVAFSAAANMATAQNLAPELMVEGTCEDLVSWSSRPVGEIRADLDAMLGTETEVQMTDSMFNTVMGILEKTAVSDSWFARSCTFSDEQLKAMEPLQRAYVAHMADKLAPE